MKRLKNLPTYVVLTLVVVVLCFPFYWMLSTSLKGPAEIFSPEMHLWPTDPTLENYRRVLFDRNFLGYFVNSLIVSTATMLIAILTAVLAGYSLSRFKYRGRHGIRISILMAQMFPPVLLLIPLFMMMNRLGLVDRHPSLIITYCSTALPFAIWMLKGYFDGIPIELEEAARVDGCTRMQSLFMVTVPVAGPGLAATAAFTFINAWQEFLYALTFMRTDSMRTLPVGISMFLGFKQVLWGQLMAAAVLVTIPVVIFFMYLQRFLVSGLTMGAVKG